MTLYLNQKLLHGRTLFVVCRMVIVFLNLQRHILKRIVTNHGQNGAT